MAQGNTQEATYAVITMWYNEAALGPYFLRHYRDASRIIIFIDDKTNDDSREIGASHPNVIIKEITFPAGFDDQLKISTLQSEAQRQDTDWVIIVDADEFVFSPDRRPLTQTLRTVPGDLIFVRMWNVYRHRNDSDLALTDNIIDQRKHGILGRNNSHNKWYSKPVAFRPRTPIELSVGHHYFRAKGDIQVSVVDLFGAHWAKADQTFIERTLHVASRMSKAGRAAGHGTHALSRTTEAVIEEFETGTDCPRVIPSPLAGRLSNAMTTFARRSLAGGKSYTTIRRSEEWHSALRFDLVDALQWLQGFTLRAQNRMRRLLQRG